MEGDRVSVTSSAMAPGRPMSTTGTSQSTSRRRKDLAQQPGDHSVLSRDWTVTAHEVYYASGEGHLLLRDATVVIPGSSSCAVVGPNVADKGALVRLVSGSARGGYFSGRITYGGQAYHDAHLLTAFVEADAHAEWESSFFGGGGGGFDSLTPSESVEIATALRFGSAAREPRYADRRIGALQTLGLLVTAEDDDTEVDEVNVSPKARAVLTRLACVMVRSPPILCVEDPFRGLDSDASFFVAKALNAASARGYTVIATLDSGPVPESAFDLAFSRVVAIRDSRICFCGEARHAASHAALCSSGTSAASTRLLIAEIAIGGKRFSREERKVASVTTAAARFDALDACLSDETKARACREAYIRSSTARRVEQDASHVEPIDEERSSVHWLAPPYVWSSTRLSVLLRRVSIRVARGCASSSSTPSRLAIPDRHFGALGVALVWGVGFWDAGHAGKDKLALYDLTAIAFATGSIVVAATLAGAPELCRRHAEFERERRSRDCGPAEFLAARTLANVIDAMLLGIAPVVLFVASGLPTRGLVLAFVYGLSVALGFSTTCLVEALAAWTHAPPPPTDNFGGGGGDFETERAVASRAERFTCGFFGAIVALMFLSTGFGIELDSFPRWNPFFWHARVNHLRWYVQGIVLRIHGDPDFHPGQADIQNSGWAPYRPIDSVAALIALFLFARLISLYFLTIEPPKLRHVDAKKLCGWATALKSTDDTVSDDPLGALLGLPSTNGPEDDDVAKKKFHDDFLSSETQSDTKPGDASKTGEQEKEQKRDDDDTEKTKTRRKKNGDERKSENNKTMTEDEARGAFALAIETYPVSLMAQSVTLGWRSGQRTRPVVMDASLSVSAGEAVLISGDDPDAPRCLLRALAGRSPGRSNRDKVGAAGRVAVQGAPRPRDWRRKCAWFTNHDGRLDQLASLKAEDAVRFAMLLAYARDGKIAVQSVDEATAVEEGNGAAESKAEVYRARGYDGQLTPAPNKNWWIAVALKVAGFSGDPSKALSDLANLERRRLALACDLALAPVAVFCDDLGGGARDPSCGSKEALAPRDAAALAVTCASLAKLGCAVVATAHEPTRTTISAFDRLAVVVSRTRPTTTTTEEESSASLFEGSELGSYLAADVPPEAFYRDVIGVVDPGRPTLASSIHTGPANARDLELRPVAVAVAALRHQHASESSDEAKHEMESRFSDAVTSLDFDATGERADPMFAGAVVRPGPSYSVVAFLKEIYVQTWRELASLRADRNALGAAIGAPFANAVLLGLAFWNQGHGDPRTVIFLGYCLFAAFAAPVSLSLPRLNAAARTFTHEADAGLATPLAFFIGQLLAAIPLLAFRVAVVVVATFAAANFLMTPLPLCVPIAAGALAALTAVALGAMAIFAYSARAAPNRFILTGPVAARRRAMVVARANDLTSLVVLIALVFSGSFRFVADLEPPWRTAASFDYLRWLLQASATPQMRSKTNPPRYDTDKTALNFVGYQDHTAETALARGALYGPLPIILLALIALIRMRQVDRE